MRLQELKIDQKYLIIDVNTDKMTEAIYVGYYVSKAEIICGFRTGDRYNPVLKLVLERHLDHDVKEL